MNIAKNSGDANIFIKYNTKYLKFIYSDSRIIRIEKREIFQPYIKKMKNIMIYVIYLVTTIHF